MTKIDEKDPYVEKLLALKALLEFFRDEWNYDYFCGLFFQPEEWKEMADFEGHYHHFEDGEQGNAVHDFVWKEWMDRRWPKDEEK